MHDSQTAPQTDLPSDRQLAPIDASGSPLAPVGLGPTRQLPEGLAGRSQLWSNIDPSDRAGRFLLARVPAGPTVPDTLREMQSWRIRHYAVHTVDSVDPNTGELQTWYRSVLFTTEGETLVFGSLGVARSLASLGSFLRPEDWAEGVLLKVTSGKAHSGGRWLALELDLSAEQPVSPTSNGKPRKAG